MEISAIPNMYFLLNPVDELVYTVKVCLESQISQTVMKVVKC